MVFVVKISGYTNIGDFKDSVSQVLIFFRKRDPKQQFKRVCVWYKHISKVYSDLKQLSEN